MLSTIFNPIAKKYKKNAHGFKKWFWRFNYPVVILIYIFLPEPVLILYLAVCSIYANEEASAAAEAAENDKNKK